MSIIGKLLKYGVTFDSIECSRQALPVLDFVRWRKPRWVTRAKSKEFVLSKRHEYNTEETEWLRRTENHYRTQMKAIWEAEQSKMNQQRQNKLLGWLNQEQLISEQFSEETLKRLQREKEAGFITPENVEQKLMESLETTADYEFALDKEGVRVINFDESTEKKQG
uniref:Small ribosomal subunit protein mS26 n=1 Tax=Magallana gigas TaxID=29159 RepID=A0A8W8IN82_MAGGI